MPKIFTTYCAMIIALLAVANHQGYVFTSLFTSVEKADKTSNHYHK
jgi:hypothetical protein